MVRLSSDLVRWFQLLCLQRPMDERATQDHALGFLSRAGVDWSRRGRQRIVRVIDGWPATTALTDSYKFIALIT